MTGATMNRWLNRAVLAVTAAALSGCVSLRDPVESFSELAGDEVVVVGRVELDPPLEKDEQNLATLGSGRYRNKAILMTDAKYRVLKEEPGMSDYTGAIEAPMGQEFYVKSSRAPFYIIGGSILMQSATNQSVDNVYLPGGARVDIRAGDRAVYIGTLRYHRNDFFQITRVQIIDDYDRVNAAFRKKFGGRYTLRKALVTPVKSGK